MSEEVSNLELFTSVLTQNSFCYEVTFVNSDNLINEEYFT